MALEVRMGILLVILLLGGGGVALVLWLNAKREERDKYYAAARNILKDEFLRIKLENPVKSSGALGDTGGQKVMVYLKTIGIKPQKRYVFNPEREIPFGRQQDESGVFLNEATVSQRHCRIFLCDAYVWLEDLRSSNGTGIKRGLFKNYWLASGQQIALRSGDVLIIGSAKLKVKLFVFDTVYM